MEWQPIDPGSPAIELFLFWVDRMMMGIEYFQLIVQMAMNKKMKILLVIGLLLKIICYPLGINNVL